MKLGSTGDTYLICSNFIERFCEMMGEVEILTTVPGKSVSYFTCIIHFLILRNNVPFNIDLNNRVLICFIMTLIRQREVCLK